MPSVRTVTTAACRGCGADLTVPDDPAATDRAAASHHRKTGHPVATVTEVIR